MLLQFDYSFISLLLQFDYCATSLSYLKEIALDKVQSNKLIKYMGILKKHVMDMLGLLLNMPK